jgi:hypothetical protein
MSWADSMPWRINRIGRPEWGLNLFLFGFYREVTPLELKSGRKN